MKDIEYAKVPGLTMGKHPDTAEVAVCRDSCSGVNPVHLFLVILTRPFQGKHPVVSQYHVLAPSAEDAISQVEENAFPSEGYVDLASRAELISAAHPSPFHVRGWGRQTF